MLTRTSKSHLLIEMFNEHKNEKNSKLLNGGYGVDFLESAQHTHIPSLQIAMTTQSSTRLQPHGSIDLNLKRLIQLPSSWQRSFSQCTQQNYTNFNTGTHPEKHASKPNTPFSSNSKHTLAAKAQGETECSDDQMTETPLRCMLPLQVARERLNDWTTHTIAVLPGLLGVTHSFFIPFVEAS